MYLDHFVYVSAYLVRLFKSFSLYFNIAFALNYFVYILNNPKTRLAHWTLKIDQKFVLVSLFFSSFLFFICQNAVTFVKDKKS